jgi:hypothetical protein
MTPFELTFDFHHATIADVLEAYFDDALSAEQDRRAQVTSRKILEDENTPTKIRRVCRVVPKRQLPAVLRPFVDGELSYREELTWEKGAPTIEMRIYPSALAGKSEIVASYSLAQISEQVVRRTYHGHVSVTVALVGKRIERGVVEDLEKGLVIAATCTQEWLDARAAKARVILPR